MGNDPENIAIDATKAEARKTYRKPLKLEKFDGVQTPLETFLAKFDNCLRYNKWSPDKCAVFLRDSLTGTASQVLWEISPQAGHDEIVKLLWNRLGNSNQMERYRAELNARRRKRGESAQAVYQDVKRLMALGFPGQSGEMYEVLSRDAFLNALNDSALRIRVLDQQPKTLNDALSIVDDVVERKRVRVVSPVRESETDKRIKELQEHLERQNEEIARLKMSANSGAEEYVTPDRTPPSEVYGNPRGYQHGGPPRAPPTGPHTAPVARAPERPQHYYAGQQRTQAGSGSRGRGTVSGRARNKLPRDVCALFTAWTLAC